MVVYFYGHGPRSNYGYFSNFYPSKFVINADIINKSGQITVYTAEQAIMWLKALLMGDEYHVNAIANERSPAQCKKYGRRVSPWDQAVWEKYRDKIAFEVLSLKFADPRLKKLLLETGTEILAEAAANDKIWGIGLSVAEAQKGTAWRGQNVLGNTLMQVRENLVDMSN